MLQTYGFENVYVLNGGYKAWKNLQNKSDVTSYTHLQNSNVTNIFIIVEIFI
jgi:3-mercaptopyruvate sulfurtransferase SseA